MVRLLRDRLGEFRRWLLRVNGGPAAESGELQTAEYHAIDLLEEEDLGELVLTTTVRLETGNDFIRDAEKLRPRDGFLELLYLLLDPVLIESSKRTR